MGLVDRIRSLCKERDITINILEQQVDGIARGSIAKWDDHAPALSKVQAVAEFFDMSLDEFLGNETKKDLAEISEVDQELYDLLTEMKDRPDLRMLFHNAKDASPEQIRSVADMLAKFKQG